MAIIATAFHAAHYLRDIGDAEERLEESLALIDEFGGLRFAAFSHHAFSLIAVRRSDRKAARVHAERAVAVSLETGAGFLGPMAFVGLARSQDDPQLAADALAEAEALIAKGCAGFNHHWAYPYGFCVSLENENLDEAERYLRLLEGLGTDETGPHHARTVAWFTAILAYARGDRSRELKAQIDGYTED